MKQVDFCNPFPIISASPQEVWNSIAQGRASISIICPFCDTAIETETHTTHNSDAKDAVKSRYLQGFILMAFVTVITCLFLAFVTGAAWVCFFVGLVLFIVDIVITLRLRTEAAGFFFDVIHYCTNCKEKLGASDGLMAWKEYKNKGKGVHEGFGGADF